MAGSTFNQAEKQMYKQNLFPCHFTFNIHYILFSYYGLYSWLLGTYKQIDLWRR